MKAGDRYGNWVVLDPKVGEQHALCRCACGRELQVARPNLISGASRRCRKCAGLRNRSRFAKSVLGVDFGCWRVTRDEHWQEKRGRRRVEVTCKRCGHMCIQQLVSVRRCPKMCGACRERQRAKTAIAPPEVVRATGVSRQGIHLRISRGWTKKEARTLPKGATPERLRRLRSAA